MQVHFNAYIGRIVVQALIHRTDAEGERLASLARDRVRKFAQELEESLKVELGDQAIRVRVEGD